MQCAAVRITSGAITLPVQEDWEEFARKAQPRVSAPSEKILVTVLRFWFAVKTSSSVVEVVLAPIAIATGTAPVEAQSTSTTLEVPGMIFVTVFAPEFAVKTLPAESIAIATGAEPVGAQSTSTTLGVPGMIFVTVFAPEFAVKTLPAESMAIVDGPEPVSAVQIQTPAESYAETVSSASAT